MQFEWQRNLAFECSDAEGHFRMLPRIQVLVGSGWWKNIFRHRACLHTQWMDGWRRTHFYAIHHCRLLENCLKSHFNVSVTHYSLQCFDKGSCCLLITINNISLFILAIVLENARVFSVKMTKFIYAACLFNGNSPRFTYALLIKDTFGCFPGKKVYFVYTKEETLTTVCTQDGWLDYAGGAPITSPITNVQCSKIVWLSSFRKK